MDILEEIMEDTNLDLEESEELLDDLDAEDADEWFDETETTGEGEENAVAAQTEDNEGDPAADPAQTGADEEYWEDELIVYGEPMRVLKKDVKATLQKGLALDRMKRSWEDRIARAENDPRILLMNELAEAEGVGVEDIISRMRTQRQFAPLLEEYGGLENIPQSVLKVYAENAEAKKESDRQALEKSRRIEREQKRLDELYRFAEKHPDVAVNRFPRAVYELVLGGESLEGAWAIVQLGEMQEKNKTLQDELDVERQNKKNKQTATASSISKAVKDDDEDDWIPG